MMLERELVRQFILRATSKPRLVLLWLMLIDETSPGRISNPRFRLL